MQNCAWTCKVVNTQQRTLNWQSTSMWWWLYNTFLLYCWALQQRNEKLPTLTSYYSFISDRLKFSSQLVSLKKEKPFRKHDTWKHCCVSYRQWLHKHITDLNSCLRREHEDVAQWKWGAGISRSLRLAIQWPAHQHVCSSATALRGLMRWCSALMPVVLRNVCIFFSLRWMMMIFELPAGGSESFDVRLMSAALLDLLFTLHSFWVTPPLLLLWPLKLKL